MRLLLDTHTILWMVSDDPRLSEPARRSIQSTTELFWSIASLWEIGIKLSLDRTDFRLGPGWAHLIPAEMQHNGIQRLPIEPGHCERLSRLPWNHRDPFDRLLVAQASCENLGMVSRDRHLSSYGIEVIW